MATEKTVAVKLKGDVSDFQRAMIAASAGTKAFTKDLDSSTDRMSNLTQSALALGPALVPISAAAIPAIAGLSNQLAFAGVAAGVTALAFQGVGKALKAVNDYSIDPTTANLEKMHETLATLGPEGQSFVLTLQKLRPEFQKIQDSAQAGLFPGVEDGLNSVMDLLPQFERIVGKVAGALGDLTAEAGANLAGPKFVEFFDFIEREARPTLIDMGRTLGNFAEAFANLWMAFAPLSSNFSRSFLDLSRDFAKWTDGLDKTAGFQEFVDYINRVGPKAWDTLAALGNALLQIVEAAAPVGEATLPVITAISKAIATIADSDLGPIIIGVVSLTSALSRLKAFGSAANSSAIGGLFGKSFSADKITAGAKQLSTLVTAQNKAAFSAQNLGRSLVFASGDAKVRAGFGQFGKYAAGAGGLAFALSGLDEKVGLSNTASLALAGSLVGPWGAAIGGGIGLAKDFAAANDGVSQAIDRANQALSHGADGIDEQAAAIDDAKKKIEDYKKAVEGSGSLHASFGDAFKGVKNDVEGFFGKSDLEEQAAALKKMTVQQRENIRLAENQRFAEAGFGDSLNHASEEVRGQTKALLDNIATHNTLADTLLGMENKEIAFEQAIDDATASVKKNGKTVKDHGTELDLNSQKGRDNALALERLAGTYNDLDESTKNSAGVTERARSEFIKVAEKMGLTKKAAQDLAKAYLHIPEKVGTTVSLKGSAAAIKAVNDFRHALDNINPFKTVTITTKNRTVYQHGKTESAAGNIFAAYAGGDIANGHQAELAGPGHTRIWREPETKGEAYIPLADDWRRPRARAIWEETGNLLGMPGFASGAVISPLSRPQRMVSQFADGGFSGLNASATFDIDYERLADAMANRPIEVVSQIDKRSFAKGVRDAVQTGGNIG